MNTSVNETSVSLFTDRYELTMLSSLLEDGLTNRPAVFEAFARRLPEGRRYGVFAGLGRLLPLIENFRFTEDEVAWLVEEGVVTEKAAEYLRTFRFTGHIEAYREGELYFPYSPVLTVTGTLGECLVLETLILSVLNYDTAVASASARMSSVAAGRFLIEMGSRRVHEQSAVAAARAAYLTGFDATSNLAAGRLYGIPTVGTAAHAFTLAHESEKDAFASQVAAHGVGTTLLVDTYDTEQGIRNAVEAAGPELGAIRLDSGDPAIESRKARALLDSLGAEKTRIVVTGDLDEYLMSALADAPVDTFGVGTRLSTGSGHPTAGMVYKLVAIAESDAPGAAMRPVAKKASGKISLGGRKVAYRVLDSAGYISGEKIVVRHVLDPRESFPGRPLQVTVMENGVTAELPTLAETRAFHLAAREELRPYDRAITQGAPSITAEA